MNKNRANNRHQRRIHKLRRRAIRAFREPEIGRAYDRMRKTFLDSLRSKAWVLAHSD